MTNVSYDAAAQTLNVTGAMNAVQQSQLLSLSMDPVYAAAVNALFRISQPGGLQTYSQPLPALLSFAFPTPPTGSTLPEMDSALSAISYDSASQQLRFTSPMTTYEETALLTLSSKPMYQAAIKSLYQQPRDFINTNFAAFLKNPADAVTQLIENQQSTTAEKVLYVAQAFMPYLQQVQSKSLITQTLCDNLGLNPTLGGLLLNTILNSQALPAPAKAMADFLALVGDGLSAAYYPNKNLSGTAALTRIDATVNFNWGFLLSDLPIQARPFSVRWTGFVMPQYSEEYTFYVRAGDGMRLWVNGQPVFTPLWIDELPTEASGLTTDASGKPTALTAGQLYPITLEYYDDTAPAQISLSWSSASTPKAIIPQSQLFSRAIPQLLTLVVNSYTLLYKAALLVNTFPLTAADVAYFSDPLHPLHSKDFAGVDPYDPTNPATMLPFNLNDLPLGVPAFTTVSSLSGRNGRCLTGGSG